MALHTCSICVLRPPAHYSCVVSHNPTQIVCLVHSWQVSKIVDAFAVEKCELFMHGRNPSINCQRGADAALRTSAYRFASEARDFQNVLTVAHNSLKFSQIVACG